MSTITISKKELRQAVKESVREALTEELMALRAMLLPYVSSEEQKDIEKRYGIPVRKVDKSIEIEV